MEEAACVGTVILPDKPPLMRSGAIPGKRNTKPETLQGNNSDYRDSVAAFSAMTPDTTAHQAARAMLNAFGSVGAKTFDLTITDRDGGKVRFRRGVPFENLRGLIPRELPRAAEHEHNVIVRPHGPGVAFIQLGKQPRG